MTRQNIPGLFCTFSASGLALAISPRGLVSSDGRNVEIKIWMVDVLIVLGVSLSLDLSVDNANKYVLL
jgi:hypothetical protein